MVFYCECPLFLLVFMFDTQIPVLFTLEKSIYTSTVLKFNQLMSSMKKVSCPGYKEAMKNHYY